MPKRKGRTYTWAPARCEDGRAPGPYRILKAGTSPGPGLPERPEMLDTLLFSTKKKTQQFPTGDRYFLYQVGESAYKYVANAIPAGMLHAIYSTIIHDLDFLDYGGEPKESKKANHFACHFAAATQKSLYNEFAAIANKLSWGKCEPNELVSHNCPAGVGKYSTTDYDSDDSDMQDLGDLSSSESESDSENESKPKVSPGKRGTKEFRACLGRIVYSKQVHHLGCPSARECWILCQCYHATRSRDRRIPTFGYPGTTGRRYGHLGVS